MTDQALFDIYTTQAQIIVNKCVQDADVEHRLGAFPSEMMLPSGHKPECGCTVSTVVAIEADNALNICMCCSLHNTVGKPLDWAFLGQTVCVHVLTYYYLDCKRRKAWQN